MDLNLADGVYAIEFDHAQIVEAPIEDDKIVIFRRGHYAAGKVSDYIC